LNMLLSPTVSNLFRANYSTQVNETSAALNNFGGATPPSPNLLLGTLSPNENEALFSTFGDVVQYQLGSAGKNRTRQVNITDSLAMGTGVHELKFGGDYRVIFLDEANPRNVVLYLASDIPTFLSTGSVFILAGSATHPSQFRVQSSSLYAEDTWRARPRLTLTYGLRWELSPAPSARGETTLAAWQKVNDPANITLAPPGTELWSATYGNFAPRLGIAYSLTPNGDFVVRGGGGIFYDLGVGSSAALASFFPNTALAFKLSVPVPLADISPFLPSSFSRQPPFNRPTGFDPNLVLPSRLLKNG
jgi:outer membrane receptor protein involved in Fe transport